MASVRNELALVNAQELMNVRTTVARLPLPAYRSPPSSLYVRRKQTKSASPSASRSRPRPCLARKR